MEASRLERKSGLRENMSKDFVNVEDDIYNDMDEEEEGGGDGFGDDEKKKKVQYGRKGSGSSGGVSLPSCQVEKCGADLTEAKRYHRRHKVCEAHAKASAVTVSGLKQRFCQQCSRFHELSEFDDAKRSCRRRLAGHNERRRKISAETCVEGTSRKGFSRQVDERGRIPIAVPGKNRHHIS